MDNESKIERYSILADDVTQIGIVMNPQQKFYTLQNSKIFRIHKSPKSLSKEGNAYSSPTRNSEGYMDSEEYQKIEKEQEQQQAFNTKFYQQYKKSGSQLVIKQKIEEEVSSSQRMTE